MIPKQIKVAGHVYKIQLMNKAWANDASRWGQCDCDEMIIRLAKGMRGSRRAETLLHEVLHAVYNVYNVGSARTEEDIVTLLSTGLHQVLVDCPELKEHI